MRGKGEGAVYRVPKDKKKPLKYWTGVLELPPGPNGERRRKSIRRKNKQELLDVLAETSAELKKRGDLPTRNETAAQWFTYWVEQIAAKEVRPNTLDGYRRTVTNHIIPAIGKIKLDKLTAAHVRRVHDAILAKGLSSTTALLAHRIMAVSFKVAVREGRIGRNPAELTAAPRRAAPKLEALDLDEAIKFLDYASTEPVMGARWATTILSGARRGEVIGLTRDRVTDVLDLSWQLIRIKLTDTTGRPDVPADYEYQHLIGGLYLTRPKSSKGWRIIPLVDPLKGILERHIANTPPNPWNLVFVSPKGMPIGPDVDSKNWRKAIQEAGITKNVRLHDGRHTAADLLYEAGVQEDMIQEILGHTTRATTRGYKTPQNRARLLKAMEQFSAPFVSPPTSHPVRELDAP